MYCNVSNYFTHVTYNLVTIECVYTENIYLLLEIFEITIKSTIQTL